MKTKVKNEIYLLDLELVKSHREWFTDSISHKAAIYGIELINILIESYNRGCLILNVDKSFIPDFKIYPPGSGWGFRLKKGSSVYIGMSSDSDGTVYCRKSDLNMQFKRFLIVEPNSYRRLMEEKYLEED